MGGKALKSVKTVRCDKAKYLKLCSDILRRLRRTFNSVEIPRHYHSKETFGDIDVIIATTDVNISEYIKSEFNPNEIFRNGNSWSFDYEETQIDFIVVHPDDFESNFNYLGFSDLSNFIGRIAHSLGARYGAEGLWVTYYFKDTKHKIMISKDYPKIYEFLGLDYKRWLNGFETLEEIFEFISESPYFNWRKFQLPELNRINRERNLKRAPYMAFLEWMSNNVADEDHEYQFDKDVSKYHLTINDFFPEANLLDEIARIDYEVSRSKYAKTIFNGKVVMDVFGLKGAELGKAMKGFREYMELNGMEDLDTAYLTFGREVMIENFEAYLQVSGVVNEG